MKQHLHLDWETYSEADLPKVGAYKYAEHPTTDILMGAYALDDEKPRQWAPTIYEKRPGQNNLRLALKREAPKLWDALNDPDVIIIAHNAEFERRIIIEVLGLNLPRTRYACTAARAAAAGLPRGLDGALAALGHSIRKDPRGKVVLRRFSQPRKPTKRNPSTRWMPQDDPERWQILLEYNLQDVVAEIALDKAIPELSNREQKYYHYITKVNDRGLPLDLHTLDGANRALSKLEIQGRNRVHKLTGGINPTQVELLRVWLNKYVKLENLQLKTLIKVLKTSTLHPKAREVISIRVEASRASTKKIKSMLDVVCRSGRAHGTLLYFGAHTGRLSGKLIQPHNFTRGLLDDKKSKGAVQAMVLDLFRQADVDFINTLLWHQPDDTPTGTPPVIGAMSMLAQSMRGFICAPPGYWFPVADYAAIEARILAWVCNEVKMLIAYRNGVDVYKMMSSALYKVPIEEVTSEQRRIGKNLTLGAGYQLGGKALVGHCEKEEIFITEQFAKQAISAYRDDKPKIVRGWYKTEEAAIRAVQNGTGQVAPFEDRNIFFEKWRDWLLMVLPSGRKFHYYKPRVEQVVKFGRPKLQLQYLGQRKNKTYGAVSTYGGKLIENMVQAIARDVMMEGMMQAEEAGYPCLASIHDEIVTLRREGEGSVAELEKVICQMPLWAKGIPLTAEGFECRPRYRKG